MPTLIKLHEELDGKWEPEITSQEFACSLVSYFDERAYYYGDFNEKGELIYFVALLHQDEKTILFWLFYMNKDFRQATKEILHSIKEMLLSKGVTTAFSQSTRLTSSYERWIEKFGAKKVAITYKFNLKD
jgi:hypothetical protein